VRNEPQHCVMRPEGYNAMPEQRVSAKTKKGRWRKIMMFDVVGGFVPHPNALHDIQLVQTQKRGLMDGMDGWKR